jgi:hypothetical protein
MRSDPTHNLRGRLVACAIAVVAALAIGGCIRAYGWPQGWRVFGVSTREVAWLDLRVITSAAQTVADGGNPYVSNPHDPTGRPLNYPSAWLLFFRGKEFSPAFVSAVALGFAAAALATLLLWMKPSGLRTGALVGCLLVSPSLLLAVERGNTDLPVFALVGLSLLATDSPRRWLGWCGVLGLLLACVLKLFPVAALGLVCLAGPAALRRPALFALVLLAGWIGLHWPETTASLANTRAGVGAVHSYGRTVLPFALELYARAHGQVLDRAPLDVLANVLTAVVLGAMSWLGYKLTPPVAVNRTLSHVEIGGLTGAVIYVLTFLAGASFNYRLWFLLFTLLWLLPLAREKNAAARWVRVGLAGFVALLFASAVWWIPLVWVAQAGSWVLFAALTVLLASCATSWLRRFRPAV